MAAHKDMKQRTRIKDNAPVSPNSSVSILPINRLWHKSC